MMHALDARTGVEVFAFIPFNLLPKLRALLDGQAIGNPDFFVDSSPKVADVRVSSSVATCPTSMTTCWRTYLFFGQGPGGTFYQALDVTLDDISATSVTPTGALSDVLTYFSNASRVKFRWSFPSYMDFDYTLAPYGDIKSTASALAKSVGETWSDPAVGQISERDRQVRAADRLGVPDQDQAGSDQPRRRDCRHDLLSDQRRRRHGVRQRGRGIGWCGRDRRQLRCGERLREVQERASGRRRRHGTAGNAIYHESVCRRSGWQRVAVRHIYA